MNLGKIAKRVLGSVAPTIATAVGGPFGGLAASILTDVFGGQSEDEIEKQLAAGNPEALLKLKEVEKQFQAKMRELDISEQDLYLKDIQSARVMAVKTGVAPQVTLAALFIGGYFIILIMVLSGYLTPTEALKDMAMILIGVLAGEVPRIMSFFFGSSKSSQDKNQYMAAAQQGTTGTGNGR